MQNSYSPFILIGLGLYFAYSFMNRIFFTIPDKFAIPVLLAQILLMLIGILNIKSSKASKNREQ